MRYLLSRSSVSILFLYRIYLYLDEIGVRTVDKRTLQKLRIVLVVEWNKIPEDQVETLFVIFKREQTY